jgi:alpha-tubulin suppressor-like RCC1 family protein
MATTVFPYIQYGGIWTASQQADAKAAGTWPVPPSPKLFSWGQNNSGQLGLGNTTAYSSPKQIGSLTTWSSSGVGAQFSVNIKADGTLWSWGQNNQGQLGLGNTTYYSSPKQVGALTNWLRVSSGYYYSIAIKTDGTLWAWGLNSSGQLGTGNTTIRSSPVQVGALTNWLQIACSSSSNNVALKTDGTLWSWGANSAGQLGLGNTTSYSSPMQVGSLTNWAFIASMKSIHTFAITTTGEIYGWGRGAQGQLGLGNTTYYSSPKQVGSLTNWRIVSCAGASTLSIKTDGTLWSWGSGSAGILGLGNTTSYSSPKQVGSLTNWSNVSAGSAYCFATKTDGTLWSWGSNGSGQLGQNISTATNISSPVQVGALTTWSSIVSGQNSCLGIAATL